MAAKTTNQPFPKALRDLMAEHQLSYRTIVERTGPYRTGEHRGKNFAQGWLSEILFGRRPANIETVYAVAMAIRDVLVARHAYTANPDDLFAPTYFREWREHVAAERARELVRDRGLDEVMRALAQLDGA